MRFTIKTFTELDFVYSVLKDDGGYCNIPFSEIHKSFDKHKKLFNFTIGYYTDKEIYYSVGVDGKDMNEFRRLFKKGIRNINIDKLLK